MPPMLRLLNDLSTPSNSPPPIPYLHIYNFAFSFSSVGNIISLISPAASFR
jgi:hypothetical protein